MKKQIVSKLSKPIASMALRMGKATVNSACFGWYHQPKVPTSMEKYKK
ncbi:MAG: cyclic lactone autoinducer peptide [Clostridiales bacterium]|nr:cyclic lactone autoinducer peptide [Clostridiales bacterium]